MLRTSIPCETVHEILKYSSSLSRNLDLPVLFPSYRMTTDMDEPLSSLSSHEDRPSPILSADDGEPLCSQSSKQEHPSPSTISDRKFLNAKTLSSRKPPHPSCKSMFFFYGSLTDPATLAKVLHLTEPPSLRPARIEGPPLKLWGPRSTLLCGPRELIVEGAAFEVQSPEQVKLLQDYGTDRYERVGLRIRLMDDELVFTASAFVWRAKVGEDELREEVSDLKAF